MNTLLMVEQQKKGIVLRRIVYCLLILIRLFALIEYDEISLSNTIFLLVFLGVCFIFEEVSFKFDYFKNVYFIKTARYVQCMITIGILFFWGVDNSSDISVVALLIMFLVDYFFTMSIADSQSMVSYIAFLFVPIAVIMLIKMASVNISDWLYILFDIIILIFVLTYEAGIFVKYVDSIERKLFLEKNKNNDILKENQEIVSIQNKLQDVNYALNSQKNDLEKAYRQIREANAEMEVQADILHYIALSVDVSKISNQITDSIMQVKQLGFCAVYIKKDVYRNKHENYVIKTNVAQLHSKLRDNLALVYDEMLKKGESEAIYHQEVKQQLSFLKDVNIKTVYVKVLGLEEDTYGLFMLGDSRLNVFDNNMSFYDAIIAQYDIAINNAKVYSDLQYMAQKDGLTGINNRIHFTELFNNEANRVLRERSCVSVALFDIDKFKNVNDTYGHLAGDEVIKRIASVTEECIDRYDGFVCRYGGEEFVVVLPNRNIEVATPIIEELFDELCKQVVQFNEYEIHMSVSVGLTAYPEVCDTTDELLKRADWCMYYAKEHGRHQIKVDDGSIQHD